MARRSAQTSTKTSLPPSAQLCVRGWTSSKAASNADGGVQALHMWLEKRSARKIIKSFVQDESLIIIVNSRDVARFTHLNGFSFATADITVENQQNKPSAAANQDNHNRPSSRQHMLPPSGRKQHGGSSDVSSQTGLRNKLENNSSCTRQSSTSTLNLSSSRPSLSNNASNRQRMRGSCSRSDQVSMDLDPDEANYNLNSKIAETIRKCYKPAQKFLDLQRLAEDPSLVSMGLCQESTAKVYAMLFAACESEVFDSLSKRQEMVESLSLAGNGLTTVKDCIGAAKLFGHVKNLDLGNNMISNLAELRYWRNKFPKLEHLILRNNPCDGPETLTRMRQWYPKLKMYNGEPIPAPSKPVPIELDSKRTPSSRADATAATAATTTTTTTTLELLPNEPHPEIPQGSTYGQVAPGKPADQLMKEQMALQFSYQTRLKLSLTEECLVQNLFSFDQAMEQFWTLRNQGKITDDLLW